MKKTLLILFVLTSLQTNVALSKNSCGLSKNTKLTEIGKATFKKQRYSSSKIFSSVCSQRIDIGNDEEKDCYVGYNSPPFSTVGRNFKLVSTNKTLVELYYKNLRNINISMYQDSKGKYYSRVGGLPSMKSKPLTVQLSVYAAVKTLCSSSGKINIEFQ